jgi:glycosyltransferase involved in cell wall biosynthesis
MRILHISGAKGWGGNEQQMVDLIPELTKLGVENIVFGVNKSSLHKECENNSINFIAAKKDKLNKFVNFWYLKKLVQEIKPNLIHLHTSDSLTVFTISDLLFRLKTKAIFSKKGMGSSSSFLSKFKYNYSGINSILCVSRNVETNFLEILTKKNKDKTIVIHDCVSLKILNSRDVINLNKKFLVDEGKFIIGNIANHTKAKDLETFINVVDFLVNNIGRKDVVFFQIGEFSKLTNNLLEIVKEKELECYIVFTNKIKNASSLNPQFDIFLMTSEREGGPTSVLEALLMGVPVVSTCVGVVPDIIEDGVNGFISEIKDYKDLALKIDELLSNCESLKIFGETNKRLIMREFTASFIAKQTLGVYQNIIN